MCFLLATLLSCLIQNICSPTFENICSQIKTFCHYLLSSLCHYKSDQIWPTDAKGHKQPELSYCNILDKHITFLILSFSYIWSLKTSKTNSTIIERTMKSNYFWVNYSFKRYWSPIDWSKFYLRSLTWVLLNVFCHSSAWYKTDILLLGNRTRSSPLASNTMLEKLKAVALGAEMTCWQMVCLD